MIRFVFFRRGFDFTVWLTLYDCVYLLRVLKFAETSALDTTITQQIISTCFTPTKNEVGSSKADAEGAVGGLLE